MKRIFVRVLATLAAAALFGGLVHAVLVAAHLSQPAATTVQGLTPQRLWATAAVVAALAGLGIGGLALRRSATTDVKIAAIVGLMTALVAVINGALNLAVAKGGPGSGNGVVGAAVAVVVGLTAIAVGGLALARSRGTRTHE